MIKQFFSGFLIGVANIIPGVSGGTMAVILGVYDELIESISQFFSNRAKRGAYFRFLLCIAFGAGAAIFACSFLFDYLLLHHTGPTYFFFMGLILASVPIVYKQHEDMQATPVRVGLCILFFVLLIVIDCMMPPKEVYQGLLDLSEFSKPLLFVSGMFAAGAMVVPGISGSFILLLLGTYQGVLFAVKTLHMPTLMIVMIGASVGMLVFTTLIFKLLKKFPSETYFSILGLLLGSVVVIYPEGAFHVVSLVTFFFGFFVALKFC